MSFYNIKWNINTYFSIMPLLFITQSFSKIIIVKWLIFSFLHTTLINLCEISKVTHNLGRREYSIMFWLFVKKKIMFWLYNCNVLPVQLFQVICFALQGMLLLIYIYLYYYVNIILSWWAHDPLYQFNILKCFKHPWTTKHSCCLRYIVIFNCCNYGFIFERVYIYSHLVDGNGCKTHKGIGWICRQSEAKSGYLTCLTSDWSFGTN
jgi:hypothetical protein